MFFDKGYDVVVPLLRRLETAKPVSGDNEFVTTNAAAIAVQAHVRGIADAVLPVQAVAGILQHLLDVDALLEIFRRSVPDIYKVCLCYVLFIWLHPVAYFMTDMFIHRRLEVACGHIHRRIHSRLEIGTWRRPVVVMFGEYYRS